MFTLLFYKKSDPTRKRRYSEMNQLNNSGRIRRTTVNPNLSYFNNPPQPNMVHKRNIYL